MRTAADLARELTKIKDTVERATDQLIYQGNSDAELHMAREVRYNPLTVAMKAARDDLGRLIVELTDDAEMEAT